MGKDLSIPSPISASGTYSVGNGQDTNQVLNDLLEGEHTIMDLRIMNNERLPETEQGRESHL